MHDVAKRRGLYDKDFSHGPNEAEDSSTTPVLGFMDFCRGNQTPIWGESNYRAFDKIYLGFYLVNGPRWSQLELWRAPHFI